MTNSVQLLSEEGDTLPQFLHYTRVEQRSRPPRDKIRPEQYLCWRAHATETELRAEAELYLRGKYKHEALDMTVKDKEGADIRTDDIVQYQDQRYIVSGIYSETEVHIIPTGEGLPQIVLPAELKLVVSFNNRFRGLRTDEELQALLTKMEKTHIMAAPVKRTQTIDEDRPRATRKAGVQIIEE